jgi:hypothetical protein
MTQRKLKTITVDTRPKTNAAVVGCFVVDVLVVLVDSGDSDSDCVLYPKRSLDPQTGTGRGHANGFTGFLDMLSR